MICANDATAKSTANLTWVLLSAQERLADLMACRKGKDKTEGLAILRAMGQLHHIQSTFREQDEKFEVCLSGVHGTRIAKVIPLITCTIAFFSQSGVRPTDNVPGRQLSASSCASHHPPTLRRTLGTTAVSPTVRGPSVRPPRLAVRIGIWCPCGAMAQGCAQRCLAQQTAKT